MPGWLRASPSSMTGTPYCWARTSALGPWGSTTQARTARGVLRDGQGVDLADASGAKQCYFHGVEPFLLGLTYMADGSGFEGFDGIDNSLQVAGDPLAFVVKLGMDMIFCLPEGWRLVLEIYLVGSIG